MNDEREFRMQVWDVGAGCTAAVGMESTAIASSESVRFCRAGGNFLLMTCESMLSCIVWSRCYGIRWPFFVVILIVVSAIAQPKHSSLESHYNAAQHLQQSGKVQQASAEYGAFIAEALGELATGYAHQGTWNRATALFDDALQLEPNNPQLLLNAAQMYLVHDDFDRAELLAKQMIQGQASGSGTVNQKMMAAAYQILGRYLLKNFQDKDARKALEKAVDLDPNFENGYALAIVCLDMEDEKCARQIFAEMERSFGNTALLHLEFGLAFGQSDFTMDAISEFKQAIAKDDRLPQAHYSLAAAYLASGEGASVKKAEAELQKELKVSPNYFLAYAAIGHLEVIQHKYAAAEKNLKHAITLNPQSPDAYLYLGQMYYEAGRTAEAEAALRKAIQYTTDISHNRYQIQKAHYLLGRLLLNSGNTAEAHTQIQIAQQIMTQAFRRDKDQLSGKSPDRQGNTMSGNATIAMAGIKDPGQVHVDKKNAQELHDFEKQLAPLLADSYNNLGVLTASAKDYGRALDYFQHAAKWNPELDGLDYNQGRAAFMSSHFQEAIPPLTHYLNAHPENTDIRSVLAISLYMSGDYAQVIKTLEPNVAAVDRVAQVEFVYADSLIKAGQREIGLRRLLSMEKRAPQIPDVHRALGEAYIQGYSPDLTLAAKELAIAVRLNPMDAITHLDMGKLDLLQGHTEAGITELETVVRLKPDNCSAHEELALAYRQVSRIQDAQREEAHCEQQASSQSLKSLP